MKKHFREVIQEVKALGAENVVIDQRGKHPRVSGAFGERRFRFCIACTPSSPVSLNNAIRDVRKFKEASA